MRIVTPGGEPTPESLLIAHAILDEIDGLLLQERQAALARVLDEIRRVERRLEQERSRARLLHAIAQVDRGLETIAEQQAAEGSAGDG